MTESANKNSGDRAGPRGRSVRDTPLAYLKTIAIFGAFSAFGLYIVDRKYPVEQVL